MLIQKGMLVQIPNQMMSADGQKLESYGNLIVACICIPRLIIQNRQTALNESKACILDLQLLASCE